MSGHKRKYKYTKISHDDRIKDNPQNDLENPLLLNSEDDSAQIERFRKDSSDLEHYTNSAEQINKTTAENSTRNQITSCCNINIFQCIGEVRKTFDCNNVPKFIAFAVIEGLIFFEMCYPFSVNSSFKAAVDAYNDAPLNLEGLTEYDTKRSAGLTEWSSDNHQKAYIQTAASLTISFAAVSLLLLIINNNYKLFNSSKKPLERLFQWTMGGQAILFAALVLYWLQTDLGNTAYDDQMNDLKDSYKVLHPDETQIPADVMSQFKISASYAQWDEHVKEFYEQDDKLPITALYVIFLGTPLASIALGLIHAFIVYRNEAKLAESNNGLTNFYENPETDFKGLGELLEIKVEQNLLAPDTNRTIESNKQPLSNIAYDSLSNTLREASGSSNSEHYVGENNQRTLQNFANTTNTRVLVFKTYTDVQKIDPINGARKLLGMDQKPENIIYLFQNDQNKNDQATQWSYFNLKNPKSEDEQALHRKIIERISAQKNKYIKDENQIVFTPGTSAYRYEHCFEAITEEELAFRQKLKDTLGRIYQLRNNLVTGSKKVPPSLQNKIKSGADRLEVSIQKLFNDQAEDIAADQSQESKTSIQVRTDVLKNKIIPELDILEAMLIDVPALRLKLAEMEYRLDEVAKTWTTLNRNGENKPSWYDLAFRETKDGILNENNTLNSDTFYQNTPLKTIIENIKASVEKNELKLCRLELVTQISELIFARKNQLTKAGDTETGRFMLHEIVSGTADDYIVSDTANDYHKFRTTYLARHVHEDSFLESIPTADQYQSKSFIAILGHYKATTEKDSWKNSSNSEVTWDQLTGQEIGKLLNNLFGIKLQLVAEQYQYINENSETITVKSGWVAEAIEVVRRSRLIEKTDHLIATIDRLETGAVPFEEDTSKDIANTRDQLSTCLETLRLPQSDLDHIASLVDSLDSHLTSIVNILKGKQTLETKNQELQDMEHFSQNSDNLQRNLSIDRRKNSSSQEDSDNIRAENDHEELLKATQLLANVKAQLLVEVDQGIKSYKETLTEQQKQTGQQTHTEEQLAKFQNQRNLLNALDASADANAQLLNLKQELTAANNLKAQANANEGGTVDLMSLVTDGRLLAVINTNTASNNQNSNRNSWNPLWNNVTTSPLKVFETRLKSFRTLLESNETFDQGQLLTVYYTIVNDAGDGILRSQDNTLIIANMPIKSNMQLQPLHESVMELMAFYEWTPEQMKFIDSLNTIAGAEKNFSVIYQVEMGMRPTIVVNPQQPGTNNHASTALTSNTSSYYRNDDDDANENDNLIYTPNSPTSV